MAAVTIYSDFGAQENKICHCFHCLLRYNLQASLVAQMVKNLPEMQETWVCFMGWEDPLEEGIATHSTILTWRIPCTKEQAIVHGVAKSRTCLRQ